MPMDRSAAAERLVAPGDSFARHTLRMHRLELDVRLGCEAEERARPQKVELDATLRFAVAPGACRSDRLDETVCYAELAGIARALVARREFRLVEHLGHEILDAFRGYVSSDVSIDVIVRKVSPPVEGLLGGVSFTIEEGGDS
jgi:7,8-dihydroneopterin aldolase/epimerase/oxygenase